MLKLIRFAVLALCLGVFAVGCENEEEGVNVKIGDGEGVQVEGEGTDVHIGDGEGVHIDGENTDVQIGGGHGIEVEHGE